MDKSEVVSALKVQRDDARRQMLAAKTEARLLLRHQTHVVQWLADEIDKWIAVKDKNSDEAVKVANEIHDRATKILEEAQRLAP